MPAKDIYHDAARNALLKDGWTITHDPYTLTFGQRNVFVDFLSKAKLLFSLNQYTTTNHTNHTNQK